MTWLYPLFRVCESSGMLVVTKLIHTTIAVFIWMI